MQGRLHSSRLPGKGFFTFFGQTIWERMCDIALALKGVEEVVFATGNASDNEIIRPVVERKGVRFFVGSEANVCERFCAVAAGVSAEYIVRVTCDNYLLQPDFIEALAARVRAAHADYGYIEPLSHFCGEVIRRQVLLEDYARGDYSPEAREHVTWDMRASPTRPKVALPADFGGVDHYRKLTLDTIDDLILMKQLEQSNPDLAPPRCVDALRKVSPLKS